MRRLVGCVVLALVASLGVAAPVVAQVVELPGGKANWMVAVGGLNTAQANSYANWTRLGWYIFATDGTVRTQWWSWNQRDEPGRVDSGVVGDCGGDVPTCGVQTMASFLKSPSGGFRGTYRYSADGQLDIDWTADGNGVPRPSPLTEHWNLELMPGGKVARISSDGYHGSIGPVTVPAGFSNYSATFGIGFGSNAPISAGNKVSIVDLRSSYGQTSFLGTFVTANSGTVARQGSGLGIGYGNWLKCDGSDCVGVRQKNSSCACKDSPNKDRIRYLADIAPARNNVYTYWCECLANGANCYRANNHVQSLLQIIDDDRLLQGWVGVETSTHVNTRTLQPDQQYSQGYWAILDMVTPDLR